MLGSQTKLLNGEIFYSLREAEVCHRELAPPLLCGASPSITRLPAAGTRSLRAAICCMASLTLVHAASSRRKQPELTFNLAAQWRTDHLRQSRFDRYISAIRARLDPHEVELSGDFAILRKARVIVTFGLCAMSPAATAQGPTPFLVDTTRNMGRAEQYLCADTDRGRGTIQT